MSQSPIRKCQLYEPDCFCEEGGDFQTPIAARWLPQSQHLFLSASFWLGAAALSHLGPPLLFSIIASGTDDPLGSNFML